MKLTLKRIACKKGYTIGKLFINGEYFCDTLEPPVEKSYLHESVAIGTGKYNVRIDIYSPKFGNMPFYKEYANGGKLPRLENVPGRQGILIHCGCKPSHTSGCILIGKNTVVGGLTDTKETFKKFYRNLYGSSLSNDPVSIEVI